MLKKLTIIEDILEPSTNILVEVDNILDYIIEHFKVWPETAKLYHNNVCEDNDITPLTNKDIENILKLEGEFFVIVYPGSNAKWYDPLGIKGFLDDVGKWPINQLVKLIMPKTPAVTNTTGDTPSSNNALSDRTNKARPLARIEDIFGTVRSTPTLIASPYNFFLNNVELEHSYMCIGKGEYDISDICEDTTLVSQIGSSSVNIFGPNKSPNTLGAIPDLIVGSTIGLPIYNIKRYSSVNGQTLAPQDNMLISGNLNISFDHTGNINILSTAGVDFRDLFVAGSSLTVSNAVQLGATISAPSIGIGNIYQIIALGTTTWSGTVISGTMGTVGCIFKATGVLTGTGTACTYYDFSGTYNITNVLMNSIVITNPTANTYWTATIALSIDSALLSAKVLSNATLWIGPFIIDTTNTNEIWCNFVAPGGIYIANSDGTKTAFPVTINIDMTPVASDGITPIGPAENFNCVLLWASSKIVVNVGSTFKHITSQTSNYSVKARRITLTPAGSSISDEVKWQDLYSVNYISQSDFGNVTTVQALTTNTTNALQIQDRKLNMLVTRKIPNRTGNIWGTTNIATTDAANIIRFICLDPFIGNRQLSEIDLVNLGNTVDAIIAYFGFSSAADFCYTFDAANLSFEETIASIAQSIFCKAYRVGSQLKLYFEKQNSIPTILFNHRNKIPNTESRTITFGNSNDYDGVEYQYVNPVDESIATIYVPSDQSAINPNKFQSLGVRNLQQATCQANRMYNKQVYQNCGVDFEATAEANICIINDRILVTDGTRSVTMEGDILDQNILVLTLSQDVNLLDGVSYTIFLQNYDGTLDSIPITKTSVANQIILNVAPSFNIISDPDYFARTTFTIVANTDNKQQDFLVSSKEPQSTSTTKISAINYDARYYQNDLDFHS